MCPNDLYYNAELTRFFPVIVMSQANSAAFCHKWHYQDKSGANVHELFSINTRTRYTGSRHVLGILVPSPVRSHHQSIWLRSFITEIHILQLRGFLHCQSKIVSTVFVD